MRHLPGFRGMGVSGRDVTPNTVTWTSVGTIDTGKDGIQYKYTVQRILGINQTVTLRVGYNSTHGEVFISVNNGNIGTSDFTSPYDPVALGLSYFNDQDTFTVSDGQYVVFGAEPYDNVDPWIEVRNVSDGNIILDNIGLELAT